MSTPLLRRSCGCIDVHTHVVPHQFPAYLGRHLDARWPSMADAPRACHRHVMLQGEVYRTVSHQAWDGGVRLGDMDRTGVEQQVLSPMPELLSYWLAREDGATMCRFLNEQIAAMVDAAPQRFHGLGGVPLQDIDAAITELDHAVHGLRLAGVEIGSNINGVTIGDPRFKPFFEAASAWGAAIFVHPLRPAGTDRLVGLPIYEQVLAFPGEIGLAAASMITGGTLAALPELRIAFSHGAGSLQVLIPRLQHAWDCLPDLRESLAVAPRDAVRRLYVDDLLYDNGGIESLVRLLGPTQVMVGTDYPFIVMDREPARRVESLPFGEETLDALRAGNARRWLGLD